jgi:hypothetical protein
MNRPTIVKMTMITFLVLVGAYPAFAATVSLTIGAPATSASIGTAGENDWFSFVVSTSGTYKIETTAGTLSDNYMYLYGPGNQTTLIEEDDDDGVGNAAMIQRSLSTGTYYVKIRAFSSSGTGTYTIRVTSVSSGPMVTSFSINSGTSSTSSRSVTLNNTCSGSPTQYMASESSSFNGASWQTYSTAPSFTLSSGNGTKTVYFKVKNSSGQESASVSDTITLSEPPVTLNIGASATSASISTAGENDWFSFVVTTSGTYKIETTAGTLSDNYMYLYGPGNQTTLIEEDDDDGVGNAAMIQRSLSAGTYYVKIRAYSSSETGTYTIRVTAPPPPSIVTLTINAPATSASIGTAGENDWFSFVVTTSWPYKIETTAGTLSDNYMYLYGPGNQTTLIEEDDDDGVGNAAMISRTLSAGTYYVKIRAFSSSGTGTYTIRVTTNNSPVVTSFAINSGTSSTSSRSVTLNNTCTGSPTQYMASESSSFSGASWQTYSPSTAPAFTLSSGNGTKTVYFKVKNSSGQESASVSDTITLSETLPVTLTINASATSASISAAGELDWYSFVVTTSGTYSIETTAGTLTDTVIDLYGPGNQTTLIEEDDDDGVGYASMISRTLSAGTYYVKVRAYSTSRTGSYAIKVSGAVPLLTAVVNGFQSSVFSTLGTRYSQNQKDLAFLSGSLPIKAIASAGLAAYVDLDDYFEVTTEGQNGWVTVSVRGNGEVLTLGADIPLAIGIQTRQFGTSEMPLPDSPFGWEFTFFNFNANLPGWAASASGWSSVTGGIDGGIGFEPTVGLGIGANVFQFATPSVAIEVQRNTLNSILRDACVPGFSAINITTAFLVSLLNPDNTEIQGQTLYPQFRISNFRWPSDYTDN